MMKRQKGPTRAAIETRPTVIADDVFAGRLFWQRISDTQQPPEGDHRYRVTHSEKFYVVQLMGTWLHITESAERTVRYRNRLKWVTFEKTQYELKNASRFKPFLVRFVQGGCYARIGGLEVGTEKELSKIVAHPFIYIASSRSLSIFNDLRQRKRTGKGAQ